MNNFFKKIFAKGKKSLRICNPEIVSGSYHQQKYSANRTQKSNFRQLCTTYKMPCRAAFTLAEVFSPYCYPPRRIAFTLAEVLITLGIIGVVAAMTLPTLIQNYQKHVTVNRLKVNYNILNNAVRRAEADFGEITTWDELLNSYSTDYDGNKTAVSLQGASIIKKYLMPYLSGAQLTETKSLAQLGYKRPILNANGSIFAPISATGPILTLKNGTVILISVDISQPDAEGKKYLYGLKLVIDIDGPNGYNTKGKDVFLASLPYARNTRVMFHQNYRVSPNTRKMEIISINREDLKNNCKTSYGNYCGALIQMDGWQIKDDYPW